MGRLGTVDPNSYAEPDRVTTVHSSLKWIVDFDNTKLHGSVTHRFNLLESDLPAIILDVRDITIKDVVILSNNNSTPVNYFITDSVVDIGSKLTLELPEGTVKGELLVQINYETANTASGLLWLTPEQTLGKKHPYMFSQCQPIHARSLLPCQDTPAVKFTYDSSIEHPKELTTLMSALVLGRNEGISSFEQPIPIPAYLLAIAIGKLVTRPLGPNSNVWGEEDIIEEAAEEFSETLNMLKVATDICGPYVWTQYDLLVMPPSFPYGGMENPCLTFVTPTVIAGDKSLADVIAHELAHSWTGNLVTNRNFEHFWLNEGFTVFIETKIVGRMRGTKEKDFHMIRILTELRECIRTQLANKPELTKLVVDLSNCGPDDVFSVVPYVKGSIFLLYIEDLVGGPEVFEPFLLFYLQKYAYKSVVSDDFKSTLEEYFSKTDKQNNLKKIDWNLWLNQEGMPPIIPKFDETLANISKELALLWSSKKLIELENNETVKENISSHQLIDFLGRLIEYEDIVDLNEEKIDFLEYTYNLKNSKNSEVKFRFIRLCIRAKLMNRMDDIIAFANSNFRMKFCRPIYSDLVNWPEAKQIALMNFDSVKNQMMTLCSQTISKDLDLLVK
ncbi:leukotriene A-4 hydrolase-like [Teleopsis dalmanni]|uniref:leukotriene A-4 hydrolase-like n=1 Tax=Teleopsis dalmanni TaxID=139649 RepID=UPI0018CE38A0|nr:leukotriene A-4 hydrolase-like [Teleopsis dalmanni]